MYQLDEAEQDVAVKAVAGKRAVGSDLSLAVPHHSRSARILAGRPETPYQMTAVMGKDHQNALE